MKIQTDVKAGGGCGGGLLNLDVDINLSLNLFGGGNCHPDKKC